jgi:Domain of unknown function (DUF4864)
MNATPTTLRRVVIFLLLPWLVAYAVAGETTLREAEWKAIRKVIAEQRTALIAGEAEKAFALAAPAIRNQVGNSRSFMTMVLQGYEAIIGAREVEFLDGDVINAIVVQPLRLVGRDNNVRVALYTMERQANGDWRISGCQIAAPVGKMI